MFKRIGSELILKKDLKGKCAKQKKKLIIKMSFRIPETSDETFNAMLAWGKAMKKVKYLTVLRFLVANYIIEYLH